jgi:seryl-tRNA synthetase
MGDPATILFGAVTAIKNAFDIVDKIDKQIENTNDQELVKNFLQLQKELNRVQKEHNELERKINELVKENDSLKAQSLASNQNNSSFSVDDTEIKILKLLYRLPESVSMPLPHLARQVALDEQKAKHYLDKLEEKEFVHGFYFYTGKPTEYALKRDGRAFLIENRLVD